MATIDRFLTVVMQNQMDSVMLEPGQRPCLSRGGHKHEVGKNPLDLPTIQRLIDEIAPDGQKPRVGDDAPWSLVYQLDSHTFEFTQVQTDTSFMVVGSPAQSSAPEASDAPVTQEAASTPQIPAVESPATPQTATSTPEAAAPAPESEVGAKLSPVTTTGEGEAVPSVDHLLIDMVRQGASDLHLSANQIPRIRLHGDLIPLSQYRPPTSDELQQLLDPITPQRNAEEFQKRNDADFAHEIPGTARFRVNLFRDRLGVGTVMRQIPHKIPTAQELGLPESLNKLAHLSKGLVLVTGPTGSGKSTTLAAIVDLINRSRSDHIITIEDPVEFVHPSRKCLVNQREVHVHTDSFKGALRAALREDPDIVLVGEMRDLETISIAIETAETGHLVFGTLHTSTAPSTVERVVDQFPGERQGQIRMMLADSLKAVIAQCLLKRIGGGRVAAYEILISTSAISNLIREGKTFQITSAMQTGKKQGMMLLNDSLFDLVQKKIVEPEEAYIKAIDKDALLRKYQTEGIKLNLATGLDAD